MPTELASIGSNEQWKALRSSQPDSGLLLQIQASYHASDHQ